MIHGSAPAMVHVYNRFADEWVVFLSGAFTERTVENEYDRAVRLARELAQRSGVPVRIHAVNTRCPTALASQGPTERQEVEQ